MPHWSPRLQREFLALAPFAAVAGPLCRATANGSLTGATRLRDICIAAGVAEARSTAVELALMAGAAQGVFIRCGPVEWRRGNASPASLAELATALEAVALYREVVHVDADLVNVVLTPPGNPSQLGDALRLRGWIEAQLEHTEATLRHLATQATERFVILTPFIDAGGMANLIATFDATKSTVRRVLVTRCPDGVPQPVLSAELAKLTAMGVAVHNYWLSRPWGYETFHAKVFLADATRAYLGSANMTQASLSVSMELGALLNGRSAQTLASVVDAVLSIALRVN